MGLRDAISSKVTGASPTKNPNDAPPEGAAPENQESLDEEMRHALISQLRPGVDLSKVALPTFVLEPRSMLERIGDSLGHAELIFDASKEDDAVERFIQVVRYFLSGWHIKVPGVKKPYNPVLGEYFRCRYEYTNQTAGYYIAEQVCHHPPISQALDIRFTALGSLATSAFYYASPDNDLEIYGELRPKSKFLGNSAATLMGGESKLRFLDRPQDGQYVISMPNMYARGILFGKMVFELGDDCKVANDANDLVCDLDFKTKGFFSGAYNAIVGKIKADGKDVGDISGLWSESMELRRTKGGSKDVLFDARGAKPSPKIVAPSDQQGEFESRRLWAKVTEAIKNKDMKAATESKVDIEEAQRERAAQREETGATWSPRYFRLQGDEYVPLFRLPEDPSERLSAVHRWIFGDEQPPPTRSSAAATATSETAPPASSSGTTTKSSAAVSKSVPSTTSTTAADGAAAIENPQPEGPGASASRQVPR